LFTELEPVLEVLLLLGNDGCGHLTVPRVGGILDCCALSTLDKLSQAIKIFLDSFECNGLPSHVCRIAADECEQKHRRDHVTGLDRFQFPDALGTDLIRFSQRLVCHLDHIRAGSERAVLIMDQSRLDVRWNTPPSRLRGDRAGSCWKNSDMLRPFPSSTEPGKGLSWIPLHQIVSLMATVPLPVAGISCTRLRGSLPPLLR
jgi:hypothetical protein